MRTITKIILFLILTLDFLSCKKMESCPEEIDLGQLEWSEKTLSWFPESYFNDQLVLTFENNFAEIKTLQIDTFILKENGVCFDGTEGCKHLFRLICEESSETTDVVYKQRSFSSSLVSGDSLKIFFS